MVPVVVLALLLDSSVVLYHRAPTERAAAVHLSVDQDGGLSKYQVQLAVEQVRRIWSAAAVTLTSGRFGEPAPAGAASISVRILTGPAKRAPGQSQVLGWVPLTPFGRPLPTLFISLPEVINLLANVNYKSRPMSEMPIALRQRLVAQAVGRAAAHELGHYLLRSSAHQDTGLMRARHSTENLVDEELQAFQIASILGQIDVREELIALAQLQAGLR